MNDIEVRNTKAVLAHSEETRRQVEILQTKMQTLESLVSTQQGTINNLTAQVGFLRAQVLNGGPTSAD